MALNLPVIEAFGSSFETLILLILGIFSFSFLFYFFFFFENRMGNVFYEKRIPEEKPKRAIIVESLFLWHFFQSMVFRDPDFVRLVEILEEKLSISQGCQLCLSLNPQGLKDFSGRFERIFKCFRKKTDELIVREQSLPSFLCLKGFTMRELFLAKVYPFYKLGEGFFPDSGWEVFLASFSDFLACKWFRMGFVQESFRFIFFSSDGKESEFRNFIYFSEIKSGILPDFSTGGDVLMCCYLFVFDLLFELFFWISLRKGFTSFSYDKGGICFAFGILIFKHMRGIYVNKKPDLSSFAEFRGLISDTCRHFINFIDERVHLFHLGRGSKVFDLKETLFAAYALRFDPPADSQIYCGALNMAYFDIICTHVSKPSRLPRDLEVSEEEIRESRSKVSLHAEEFLPKRFNAFLHSSGYSFGRGDFS